MEISLPSEELEENRRFCVERFRRIHEVLSAMIPLGDDRQYYRTRIAQGAKDFAQSSQSGVVVECRGPSGLELSWHLLLDKRPRTDYDAQVGVSLMMGGQTIDLYFDAMDGKSFVTPDAGWFLFLSEEMSASHPLALFLGSVADPLGLKEPYAGSDLSETDALDCARRMAEYFLEHHLPIATAQDPCA